MAGRALLGVLQLPDTQQRCVILLVHEKVMPSGTSKNPAQRALKRIAPKLLELVIVSLPIAWTFCGRLLDQYLKTMSYFDPAQDWPKPIEDHVSMAVVWEEPAFWETHAAAMNSWCLHKLTSRAYHWQWASCSRTYLFAVYSLHWRLQANSRRAVQRSSSGCQSTQTVATAVRAPSA